MAERLKKAVSLVPVTTNFTGNEFELASSGRVLVRGYVDEDVLNRINSPPTLLQDISNFHSRFSGAVSDTRRAQAGEKLGEDLANFLFISSLLDYGNIGTSETFSMHMMELYTVHKFLFQPSSKFWEMFRSSDPEHSSKMLQSLLLRLSGLLRTDFTNVVVPSWASMIQFLHSECNNDAAEFYLSMCRLMQIDPRDPDSLDRVRSDLLSPTVKGRLGIKFPWGEKISLLLLSQMTDSSRGYNVLHGVTREHVKRLKAPVDSAVIRVMLNTGMVKNTYVNPSLREGKLARTDMTRACQSAMDMLADKLAILPIELDIHVWAVGTLPCKHRGKFCFICPLTTICDSWRYEYSKESSGAEYSERCFSFARPQTEKNALYVRGCLNCPHQSRCRTIHAVRQVRHPCFNDQYLARRYREGHEKLDESEQYLTFEL